MKTVVLAATIGILAVFAVHATAQFPDYIIYDGQRYPIHTNPLEPFFASHPEKRPAPSNTALWRGYIATFAIEGGKLYAVDVETFDYEQNESGRFEPTTRSIFGEIFSEERVPIDWFTGIIVIPLGEIVEYVHLGYGSVYEHYILLEIENGTFKAERRYSSDEYNDFRQRQFEQFRQTEEYRNLYESISEEGSTDADRIDAFLYGFITEYSTRFLVD